MKKTLILAGVLGTFAMSAHAQSSVTLYGSLDAGLAYVNNAGGHSLWAQGSGLLSNTYFGLKGAEDLGGGTKAIFKLESGFNLNNGSFSPGYFTGNSSGMFTRQAFVGLQNNQFGTLTLGRQFDSVADYLTPLALAGQAGGINVAAHPFNNDNIGAQFATSNAIKYESVNYAGFHFGGQYGFSNSTQFASGRQWSVGAGYENGPFKVAAAYDQMNNVGTGANATANSGAGLEGQSFAFGSADVQRTVGVGANYAYGPGTVGLLWTHSRLQGISALTGNLNARFDNIELNGTYALTPALALVGEYTYTWSRMTEDGNSTSPKWHSVTVGADYGLSKRTDVYLAGVYQHSSSVDSNGVSIPSTSIGGILPSSSTQNQVAVTTGIRHRF
ncbi:porin [Paraburkholderia dinghuensis]|uniref:Porin n=1 Tax=Paraburkholderia dinghuensis TaxID=2305225 RepID=A0A3N6NJK6_9BURK|nr:porin [Paraburkholderia dinghuensis]RQH09047.1 porin [Paraburkholderia dinghuensis]